MGATLAILAALALGGAVPASATTLADGEPLTLPFPRLAMWWPDTETATPAELARYDWIALGTWDDPAVIPRIKALNPDEIVLNSTNACEIDYDPDQPASAGVNDELRPIPTEWLLTQVGATLTSSVTPGSTTLAVSAVSAFDDRGESVPLFVPGDIIVLGPELARVVSINAAAKTLAVKRGVAKAASAHASGTRIAATISFWPGSLMLDLTAACPRATVETSVGPESWAEYNARIGAALVAGTEFDGLLIDRSDGNESWLIGNSTARSIDPDRSNTLPGDYSEFDDAWNSGLHGYELRLRGLIPAKPILGNWAYPHLDVLNGTNFEGFPNADPTQYPWSSATTGTWPGKGSYFEWMSGARQPNLTTIETYEDDGGPDATGDGSYANPADEPGFKPNLRKMRYGLTTALLGDGFFSYEINTNGHGSLGLLWFDEYTGGGRGRGYLGLPTGPARRVAAAPTSIDLLAGHGDFDTAPQASSWDLEVEPGSSATTVRDFAEKHSGAASLRVSVVSASGTDWHVSETHSAAVRSGSEYTLSFWARADRTLAVSGWIQQANEPWNTWAEFGAVRLDTEWRQYVLVAPSGGTDPTARLQIGMGESPGKVWIDDIRLQSGSREVWRRKFSGGVSVVNATASTARAPLGGLYRLAKGSQSPKVNTGRLAYVVTIGPRDGRVLASVDATALADSSRSAARSWRTAASRAHATAHHFGRLAARRSGASRRRALRSRDEWLRAMRACETAETACYRAREKLLRAQSAAPAAVASAASASRTARGMCAGAAGRGPSKDGNAAVGAATGANRRISSVYESSR
ncbi:MAG: hypothetical protein HGB10_08640 [Coriobacteriia bacterium]|nr:hypothetical protein [Coriobacteriia bacterium]